MADNRDDDIKKSFSKLAQQCMAIVDTHVQSNSCLEINIPCDMRHSILNKVLEDGNEICDYHPDLFTPASEAVLELMRSNSFLPWLGQWDPSMLPTPPLSDANFFSSSSSSSLSTSNRIYPHRASSSLSSLTWSFSSPDGWNIVSSSSPRLSISSFQSTNDTILPLSSSSQQTQLNHRHQQQKNHHHQPQRRVGGLSYQTMLKRMKDCFVNVHLEHKTLSDNLPLLGPQLAINIMIPFSPFPSPL
ncbi:unnamed protein product [Absidia cylindrospora]